MMVFGNSIKRWGTLTAASSSSATTASITGTSTLAQRLLNDKTYNIEFQGYLSNHVKHAIIALDKLNASDERIQEYWDQYTHLTPYSLSLEKLDPSSWDNDVSSSLSLSSPSFPCTDKEWNEWRGNKVHWQEMIKFLDRQGVGVLSTNKMTREDDDGDNEGYDIDDEKSIDAAHRLVKKYAPDLLPGIAGALTHGIIHLGWGIDSKNYWMMLEGLSYLNFSYLPVNTHDVKINERTNNGDDDATKTDIEIINEQSSTESVMRIANIYWKDNLQQNWIEKVKSKYDETFHPELVPAGFQWHLSKVLHEPHHDIVARTMPSWLQTMSIDELFKELYHLVTLIYLGTRTVNGSKDENNENGQELNGNFIILHLLTSLWGLEQVCRVLVQPSSNEDNEEEVKKNERMVRQALQYYWSAGICLLSTSNNGFPKVEQIEQAINDFPMTDLDDVDAYDWSDTVRRGCAEEEEHNIKLVYVCRELWYRYGPWKGFSEAARSFTLTPNIGPSQVAFSTSGNDAAQN